MPDKTTTSVPPPGLKPALGSESKPAPHRRSVIEYASPRPLRRGFRARLIDFLKSLIWVAPLTLLIWVYAEREQTLVLRNVECPVELQTTGLNRAVIIPDRKSGSRREVNLSVTLDGPAANVYAVERAIGTSVADHPALQISLGPEFDSGSYKIEMRSLLDKNPLFASRGVTVRSCEPGSLMVQVDTMVDKSLPVHAIPMPDNVVETPIFEPATVMVRAPASYFDEKHKNQLFLCADLTKFPQVKQSGKHDLPSVPITWPLADDDDRVTLGTASVEAVVTIAAPTTEAKCQNALLVWVQMPPLTYRDYRVEYDRSLPDVVVKGPAEIVNKIAQGKFDPLPRAVLVVQPDDDKAEGSEITHFAKFENLPEGVQVVNQYPIPFRLIKRTSEAP